MKNGFVFFAGLFGSIALSWGGLVLGSHKQLGGLAPFFDEGDSTSYPNRPPGVAARGQLVYADLGCASCHTQQVRRPDVGADQARGWGERQSVARDYIFQLRPQLGASRIGPDLTNLAGRKPSAPDADDLMKLLYAGSELHPAYGFLFENRPIVGERSAVALKLTGALTPAPGREIVPTERAQSLVAYLLSLNNTYDYPESRPLPKAPAKPDGAHGAAPTAKKEGEKK
ncbi:MAG: cbb3-type cytochrome c oxidase subunit II [Verrucomicrobia bacterium]|nr:cbb3-type cytochrome c oxidase subunit II [Verrucomicrobiota bacterium]